MRVVAGEATEVSINGAERHRGIAEHHGNGGNIPTDPATRPVRFNRPCRDKNGKVTIACHARFGPHNAVAQSGEQSGNTVSSDAGPVDRDAHVFGFGWSMAQ